MNSTKENEELSAREQHLLRALVDGYITEGQPIGSRTLAKHSGLDLSAATIRNVMADLEERGYLRAPHTSAGRVPTSRGYRFFVDTMLQVQPFEDKSAKLIGAKLDSMADSGQILQSASNLISNITSLAGVVSLPKDRGAEIDRIEFLSLSKNQVLVILVLSNQEIQNRIIQLEQAMSSDELMQAANFLNDNLLGKVDLKLVREKLLQEMRDHRQDMNRLMESVIELGEEVVKAKAQDDGCVIAGEMNLMDYDDLSDIQKLRDLFAAFNQKQDILSLLDKSIQADGIHIFIGRESGYDAFDDVSLVTAPYRMGEEHVGVLGVIGPKRMAYERVIPVVDMTSKLLSTALSGKELT